mmetsp:Transcript_96530/g.262212  ORF Transcript_96530/g.262212 Transcript_96530/m.262212 type:complete len:228 (-) Transcript_96530:30-713(-)
MGRQHIRRGIYIVVMIRALERHASGPGAQRTAVETVGPLVEVETLPGVALLGVLERTEGVDVLVEAFEHHLCTAPDGLQIGHAGCNVGIEVRALRALHAVRREVAALRDEGTVVPRVVVPRGHHEGTARCEVLHQPDHHGDYDLALRDGESAPPRILHVVGGDEVVLHVNDHQAVLRSHCQGGLADEVLPAGVPRQPEVLGELRGVAAVHPPSLAAHGQMLLGRALL